MLVHVLSCFQIEYFSTSHSPLHLCLILNFFNNHPRWFWCTLIFKNSSLRDRKETGRTWVDSQTTCANHREDTVTKGWRKGRWENGKGSQGGNRKVPELNVIYFAVLFSQLCCYWKSSQKACALRGLGRVRLWSSQWYEPETSSLSRFFSPYLWLWWLSESQLEGVLKPELLARTDNCQSWYIHLTSYLLDLTLFLQEILMPSAENFTDILSVK